MSTTTERPSWEADRDELEAALWAALLEKIEEIKAENNLRPSYRGRAMVSGRGQHPNHLTVTVLASLGQKPDDGSEWNYLITAHRGSREVINFEVKHWVSHHDDFWNMQLEKRDNAFVADGRHYRINPDLRPGERGVAGFGGSPATVKFFDGRVVETRNLWSQGVVPAPFRDRLPDDAELVWSYTPLPKALPL